MAKVRILKMDGFDVPAIIDPVSGCHIPLYPEGNPYPAHWSWNGDFDKPTFKPSVKIDSMGTHFFITDGKIQFLEDCTHNLKGQTVDMIDIDEEE